MTETTMETAVLSLIWLLLYGYCIEGMGTIQKGRGRRIVAGLISLLLLALSLWIPLWAVWLLEGLTAVLFVLFFDGALSAAVEAGGSSGFAFCLSDSGSSGF